jgi:hypothetical protein
MNIAVRIIGAFLILAGGVWFLQGINILPGSFMTGQIQWAVYGTMTLAAGIGLIAWSGRRGKPRR